MTEQMPAPSPSGYQPSPGEGLAYIDIEVRPSRQYQTVGMSGRVVFPEPRSYSEALPAIEDAYQALEELANAKIDQLAAVRDTAPAGGGPAPASQPAASQAAPAPAPQPQAQQPMSADQFAGQLGGQQIGGQTAAGQQWAVGQKPNGRGSFKYLTTATVPTDQFRQLANQSLQQLGVDPQHVMVFDDRTGQYGLEGGNTTYSAGKAKAGKDTQLKQMLGDRDIVAYLDFEQDGSVKASLTKDARAAIQALSMMQQAQQPAQQPAAPPPTDADLPF